MDILNWLYLAKNKFVRTTLGSTKDLMIFGSNVGFGKRGDKYQNYAMSAEDFTTSVADVVKPYKVYTALLSQTGGDNQQTFAWEYLDPTPVVPTLLKGVSYYIDSNDSNTDFTIAGASNNNDGTHFIANGVQPNWQPPFENLGDYIQIEWNTGAPTVRVLENTIGNVWCTFTSDGFYSLNSNGLFTDFKTFQIVGSLPDCCANDIFGRIIFNSSTDSECSLFSYDSLNVLINDQLVNTPIEIRVYN